jgi:hypothetical protein
VDPPPLPILGLRSRGLWVSPEVRSRIYGVKGLGFIVQPWVEA